MADQSAALPDRLEERLAAIDLYDRVAACELLQRAIDAYFDRSPRGSPCDGSRLLYLLHVAMEERGEAEPDRAKVDAVFDHLRAMPLENSRALLGGWARSAFLPDDAKHKLEVWLELRPLPTLALEVADGGEAFYCSTDEVHFLNERRPVIQLHIAAGASKREVLDSLETLVRKVKEQWGELVAGKLRSDLLTDAERERGEPFEAAER